MLNKSTNGNLQIRIRSSNNTLICTIEDNGIGREAAAAIKGKKLLSHESLGIRMTEERMQMLERITDKRVKIAVYDLKDEAGAAAGTKVQIEITGEDYL
ncbi:MAG: hypothetical protein IPP46_14135 [Bacteroidetes bacterium]|nr:hypothetical protein [Bacteroidota bacterium]